MTVREDIRNQIARLAHAGDLGDAAEAASLYAEDGVFRTEGFPREIANDGQMTGRDQIEAGYRGLFESNAGLSRHWVGNIWFVDQPENPLQHVRSYFAIIRAGLAPVPGILMTGTYDDEFVKEDGVWLLRCRVCLVDPLREHRSLVPTDVLIGRLDAAGSRAV